MKTALLVALLMSISTLAHADDSFEAKAQGAKRVQHLDSVVWALTATCDAGDDTQQRQCRHVRDARLAELAGATLLVDGEHDAFQVGNWSQAKKSIPMTLSACIRCGGVEVEGKTWYIVALGMPFHFEGGKLKAGTFHDNARTFPDEGSATAWAKAAAHARVQLLAKIPPKPRWTESGKTGIALDVVAYRVYTPCDGAIVTSNPPSGPAEADKNQCGSAKTP
jgi:hypothetical protein